jgi:replicative DNA helicase
MSDRVAPHNLEAEKAVLGACLLYGDLIPTAASILKPEDFFRMAHSVIFRLILKMPAVDTVLMVDGLLKAGELEKVGGPAYVASLTDGVPRSTNVDHYATIVRDLAILRGIIAAGTKAVSQAYEAKEPAGAIVDVAFTDLLLLSQQATGVGLVPVQDGLSETMTQLLALADPSSTAWGHRTGLQALDRKIRGLRPGKLLVVAGRPGDGKTSLVLNLATAVAKGGDPVAVFALEQSREELRLQLVSSESRVNIEDLADEKCTPDDWNRINRAVEMFETIPLYIDDTTDLTPITLRAKARRMQLEHGLALVVVDYVQLMNGLPTSRKNENENEKLTGISRSLKVLSKDLGVPIIICCQLNRAPDARQDGRPLLSDLRGSGSLEQDADSVILIFDPSKAPKRKVRAKKRTDQIVEEEIQKGVVELIVAKNRGLSTGSVRVLFRKEITKFENLAL